MNLLKTIILSNDKTNRILMKSLIKNIAFILRVIWGLRSAELDIKSCLLLFHDNRDDTDKVKDEQNYLSRKLNSVEV